MMLTLVHNRPVIKMLLALRWPLETGCIINLRAMLPGAVYKTGEEILNWNKDNNSMFQEKYASA